MIKTIKDKRTRQLASGIRVPSLPPEIQPKAMRLLRLMIRCKD